ncbi:MAG: protein phosphatase 2C domain-containing protein [Ruminococcus sp.]|nr:protein phosphatase 2C domain-containing protein [Ruminococcus sp.]
MIINSAKYSCAAGHDVNEDSCLCDAQKGIFIVADGLGGHSSGEIASLAAVDYFEENCGGGYTEERVTELMEGANKAVLQKGDKGKTTVAAAFIENGNFIYANAGDSRVYYFRNGRIIARTKDHSVCQASVDMGMLSPEDIRGNEDRSRLLKVLGSEESLNIKKHYQPVKIENGDAFLICSDGFWEYVYENEMEADLLKSETSDSWLKYMLKRHILRAENRGDNYTAVCGIFSLDGSETYIPPASGGGGGAGGRENGGGTPPEKNGTVKTTAVAAGAAAAAVIAVLLAVFLGNRGSVTDTPDITDISDVTETSGTNAADTQTFPGLGSSG